MGKKPPRNGPQPADGEEMSLGEWLANMRHPKPTMICQRFPYESWKDEYLATITGTAQEEVLLLIRSFLIESGFTNRCDITYRGLVKARKKNPEFYRKALTDPFNRRLVQYAEDLYGGHPPPWEGNTWIADLLPEHPKLALQGLEAYTHAYLQHFSDNQMWGHHDVQGVDPG